MTLSGDFTVLGDIFTHTVSSLPTYSFTYTVPVSNTGLIGLDTQGVNLATSSSGQYVSICADGIIRVSNDFGVTFTTSTFDSIVFSIAMSHSGKYQCAGTTGIPKSVILVSQNYGVTWVEIALGTGYNYKRWIQTVCVSPNGAYMACGGSNSIFNYVSTDFGSTFVGSTSTSDKITSAVSDQEYIVYADETGAIYGMNHRNETIETLRSASDPVSGTYSTTSIPGSISLNPDGTRVVLVGPQGITSGILDSPLSYYYSRTDFLQVVQGNNAIWGRTSSNVCISTNYGADWSTVFSGPGLPRTIASSADNTILYILLQNGHLIRQFSTVPNVTGFPGTVIKDVGADVPFGFNNTTIQLNSIKLSRGTWALTLSFGMKAVDTSQDSDVPKKIFYGIGQNFNTTDIFSSNSLYTIKLSDSRSWQSFNSTTILRVDNTTTVYSNAKLNFGGVGVATTLEIHNPILSGLLLF